MGSKNPRKQTNVTVLGKPPLMTNLPVRSSEITGCCCVGLTGLGAESFLKVRFAGH